MRGLGRIFKRGSVYWIAYYHRGHRYRESSHSESESQARRLLKQRLGEITAGRFIGPSEDRLTFDALVADLENDYKANNRRSLETVRFHVTRLQRFFGFDRAVDITPDRVKAYQVQRLDEEASRATINREVACLGRMLSLAVNSGKLSRKPKFQLLDGERVRQGFLEHGDFLVLLGNLPAHLESLTEFLYLSGWRKGEALKLEWKDVDLQGRTVRLRMENSKNKEARILPLTDRLWEIVQERTKKPPLGLSLCLSPRRPKNR
jgi:integrase